MKKTTLKLCLILLLGLTIHCSFAATLPTNTNIIPLDKTVVIVNDDVITQHNINNAMAAAKHQLTSSNTPLPNEQQLKKQVIDNLINHKIQLQMIKRANIQISNSEAVLLMRNIVNKFVNKLLLHAYNNQ